MPMRLDPLSQEYIALAFAIERHVPGFVDAYVGPEDLRDAAQAAATLPPERLGKRASALAGQVAESVFPEPRRAYLSAQLRAMAATCARLAGEAIGYADEVHACFGIEPAHTPESTFDAAIAELDDVLPGTGPVAERMITWRERFVVGPETAQTLIARIVPEVRRRAAALAPLPPGEAVTFELVRDKPWSGYNWYLGHCRSRVEINTDLPLHANVLTDLVCHEAYPGHHTEHATKEQGLYRERGYGEHAIFLINTPECVISEGIATLASEIAFPRDELYAWQEAELYPIAGIAGDAEREARIARAVRALRAVGGNAALLLHEAGAPEDEVVAYLMRYGLRSEPEARHSLRFLADPLWRAYIFTYHAGRDLLGAWLDAGDATQRFRTLLTEQVTPSQVQRWTAGEGNG